MTRAKKPILLTVAAAALLGVAGWTYTRSHSEPKQQKRAPGPGGAAARVVTVELVKAQAGRISERLLITGALKPKEQVDVTPKATGRVEKIYVNVGDRVEEGAPIAELEDDELQQQVRRAVASLAVARASLAQREAELRNARAELDRAESLRKDGLISAQDYAARQTNHDVIRAQVELAHAQQQQADAELRELKIRLSQSRIQSPMNGYVATRFVDTGALVSPTTPIVRLVNIATMVTAAGVPERDVAKLRVGNTAEVHVDAFGEQVFRGRVARISPVLDAATRSAVVEIEIPNPQGRLRAEMFVRVELDLATTRQALLIPRDALVYRGTQAGVFTVQGDRPVFRSIETGLTEGDRVEVLANLSPGAVLVGRGAAMLQEGDRVAPAATDEAAAQPGRTENRTSPGGNS
ncbi:MAG: efflux RND transporter periplasmic adaptor subunit [Bryobacterales bacterium]|nr:efflux RND transporter periplasmic adaptor subunit [Bryobacterales bacterium]